MGHRNTEIATSIRALVIRYLSWSRVRSSKLVSSEKSPASSSDRSSFISSRSSATIIFHTISPKFESTRPKGGHSTKARTKSGKEDHRRRSPSETRCYKLKLKSCRSFFGWSFCCIWLLFCSLVRSAPSSVPSLSLRRFLSYATSKDNKNE